MLNLQVTVLVNDRSVRTRIIIQNDPQTPLQKVTVHTTSLVAASDTGIESDTPGTVQCPSLSLVTWESM